MLSLTRSEQYKRGRLIEECAATGARFACATHPPGRADLTASARGARRAVKKSAAAREGNSCLPVRAGHCDERLTPRMDTTTLFQIFNASFDQGMPACPLYMRLSVRAGWE
jgi:hypothetical protein